MGKRRKRDYAVADEVYAATPNDGIVAGFRTATGKFVFIMSQCVQCKLNYTLYRHEK